jgi:GGDEF domain-containing protein
MRQVPAAIGKYTAIIRAVAQYAPKLSDNPEEGNSPERGYLLAMAAEVASGDPALLPESRSYLRCVLREYHDESARYLANLQRELTATAGTLHDITCTLAESDAESGARLVAGVERLKQLAGALTAQPFADVVRAATADLDRSIADMRKQRQLILSQLHTEIRLLRKRMDALAEDAADDLSKLMPRDEMERRIAQADAGTFRLLLLKVDGLSRARIRRTAQVFAALSVALARRMRNNLPAGTAVSRWSEEGFVALLVTDIGQAKETARRLQKLLSGPYICRSGAKTVLTQLQASVEVLGDSGSGGHDM